jgi:hypothetical protein
LESEGTVDHASEFEHELVDQMCAVTGLDAPEGRDLLISMLADRLPDFSNVRRHGRTRLDLLEIVRSCLRDPRGLPALLATLYDFAPGSDPLRRITELVESSPVLAIMPQGELRKIRALLGRARHLDAHALLYAAAGDLTPLPDRPPATLPEAFDFLAGANARADGLLPVMALVEHAAAGLDEPAAQRPLAAALRDWNDSQAVALGLAAELQALRSALARRTAAEPAPACLVVQLTRHGIGSERYVLSYWRQMRPGAWQPERGEDRMVALSEVESAVEQLIGRAEADWSRSQGSPALEFVLPLHLLNEPLEWLPMASRSDSATALCLSYPVAVRSLERMRAKEFHRRWRNRWQRMMDSPGIACHWDTSGRRGHDSVQWNGRLAADEGLASVALSAPPLPGPAGSRASLEAALRAGVPLAVWDRRDGPPGEFRKRVKELMKGPPAELPDRVRRLRHEAATAAAAQRHGHPGRHLAVLWDDPNRLVDWAAAPAVVGLGPADARDRQDDKGDR